MCVVLLCVYRCGFLGMLHLEVFMQRLEQEHRIEVVTTTPTVMTLDTHTHTPRRTHTLTHIRCTHTHADGSGTANPVVAKAWCVPYCQYTYTDAYVSYRAQSMGWLCATLLTHTKQSHTYTHLRHTHAPLLTSICRCLTWSTWARTKIPLRSHAPQIYPLTEE